jgi:metal-responsive CopG/Arc/MetJ family transcriptional regulator
MVRREREKLSLTIPPDLIAWLDEMVDKRTFSSRSHGVELCILKYKEEAEQGRK